MASLLKTTKENRATCGMMGLNQSMFEYPGLFEVGLMIFREDPLDEASISDELLNILMENHLLSAIISLENSIGFLPALYKYYADEIEKRSDKRFEASWI